MQLLTAQEINTRDRKQRTERIAYIVKLRTTEKELVQKVNDARIQVDKQITELDVTLEKHRTATEQQKLVLNDEIEQLIRKIETLEKRKAEALKPIDSIREAANELSEAARAKMADVTEREEALAAGWRDLTQRIQAVEQREKTYTDMARELHTRVEKVGREEKRIKDLRAEVTRQSESHSENVAKDFKAIERGKQEALAGQRANEAIRKTLDEKAVEQKSKDREIRDRFATLERARQFAIKEKLINPSWQP